MIFVPAGNLSAVVNRGEDRFNRTRRIDHRGTAIDIPEESVDESVRADAVSDHLPARINARHNRLEDAGDVEFRDLAGKVSQEAVAVRGRVAVVSSDDT